MASTSQCEAILYQVAWYVNRIVPVFDHDYKLLVGLAGLETQLSEQEDRDPEFAANWAIATEWKPDVRYETVDVTSAQFMINAIAHEKSGVLQWTKIHW